MIGNIILPSTAAAEWPKLREEIRARVVASMGAAPEGASGRPAKAEEIERFEKHGLTHVRLRYHVLDDAWNEMICVLPAGGGPAPAVFCCHGTTPAGKLSVIDPKIPNRAYGLELARRGYVTVAVDQFGFGATLEGTTQKDLQAAFFRRYPDWSLDGRRTLDHTRAVDALQTLPFVAGGGVGAVGNSLGGRAVIYFAALDERVKAAVPSTGISPNATNVFRSCTYQTELSPALSRAITKNGVIPWDYHEMIALVAPRALLVVEPWNDSENPYVAPTFECFRNATAAWRLLGAPKSVSMLIHGDGHDTTADVREAAYRWFDRFLKQG